MAPFQFGGVNFNLFGHTPQKVELESQEEESDEL